MDSTGMILACLQPLLVNLDTLYSKLLASGVVGIGENHSTYARCVGAVTEDRKMYGIALVGS